MSLYALILPSPKTPQEVKDYNAPNLYTTFYDMSCYTVRDSVVEQEIASVIISGKQPKMIPLKVPLKLSTIFEFLYENLKNLI